MALNDSIEDVQLTDDPGPLGKAKALTPVLDGTYLITLLL